jgi:tRNA(Ile)-lysidine synthase
MHEIWEGFEHKAWSAFLEAGISNSEELILMISGGLDSMVLLELTTRLKPSSKIVVVHIHHGLHDLSDQIEFRNKTLEFVKKRCIEINVSGHDIEFISFKSDQYLSSEEKMRNFRFDCLNKILNERKIPVLTAHHLDDRVETILLKLIRGSSIDGISGFKQWDGKIFRPLLNFRKKELLEYAEKRNINWFEDPSNSKNEYLRNWLRNDWLPSLEAKDPSFVLNLSRSLIKIVNQSIENDNFKSDFQLNTSSKSIERSWFLSLNKSERQRCLALILRQNSIYDFTSGQIDEIIKRIENNQREIKFEILGIKWVINASQIMLG